MLTKIGGSRSNYCLSLKVVRGYTYCEKLVSFLKEWLRRYLSLMSYLL